MKQYLPNLIFILALLAVLGVVDLCCILTNRKLKRELEAEKQRAMKMQRMLERF